MLRLSESQFKSLSEKPKSIDVSKKTEYDIFEHITYWQEKCIREKVDSPLLSTLKLFLKRTDGRKEYEKAEQCMGLLWLLLYRQDVFEVTTAVPMGGYRPHGAGGQIKGEGAKKGWPDVIVDYPSGGYHGLRIEVKKYDKNAKASDDQKAILRRLSSVGYRCITCRGHFAMIQTYCEYLGMAVPAQYRNSAEWCRDLY